MYREKERHDVGRGGEREKKPENRYHRETRQRGNDLKPIPAGMLYRRYKRRQETERGSEERRTTIKA